MQTQALNESNNQRTSNMSWFLQWTVTRSAVTSSSSFHEGTPHPTYVALLNPYIGLIYQYIRIIHAYASF